MVVRVMLADGQLRARSALRLLFEQEQEFDVVGESAWACDLVAQVKEAQPDLLLLDWALPGLRGADLLPALRDRQPDLKVVALSGRPEAAQQALAAGADAFVSKGEPPERLLEAVRGLGGGLARRSR